MKILVIGNFRYEMYARAFYNAWVSLGHSVFQIDYQKYYLKSNDFFSSFLNKFQSKYFYGYPLFKYNRDIIDSVNRHRPDFVFFYSCDHVFDSTLKQIRKKTIIISYNNDNPFTVKVIPLFRGNFISNGKYCDLVYVYRKSNIEDFSKIGVFHTKVLYPYYLANRNYPIKNVVKSVPIAFIGHWEDDGRDKTLVEMYKAGLPIAVYGADYWLKKSKYADKIKEIYHGLKMGDEYNQLLNQVQIALVFYSRINKDTYTRRCFEIPATKTLMLAPYTEEMEQLFPEGEGVVYYRSQEELIGKCRKLLDNPEEIRYMAERGYLRLQEIGGSEMDRCVEIIEDVESIMRNK